MILSFLLAVAAGFAVPYVEPYLRRAIDGAVKPDTPLAPADMRVLTLLTLLGLSALVTAAAGANTVSLSTVLGGILGYFAVPLYAFLRDPDGTDVPDEARWDGRVRPEKDEIAQDDAQTLEAVSDALRNQPPRRQPDPDKEGDR